MVLLMLEIIHIDHTKLFICLLVLFVFTLVWFIWRSNWLYLQVRNWELRVITRTSLAASLHSIRHRWAGGFHLQISGIRWLPPQTCMYDGLNPCISQSSYFIGLSTMSRLLGRSCQIISSITIAKWFTTTDFLVSFQKVIPCEITFPPLRNACLPIHVVWLICG